MTDITIVVPSGVGDFSWIYSKFCNLNCNIHVQVAQTGGYMRLPPFLELLPKVSGSSRAAMNFGQLRSQALPCATALSTIDGVSRSGPLYLEANTHLETGNRIETWIPELPTDYHYDIVIPKPQIDIALSLIPQEPYVAIFAAAKATAAAWLGWQGPEWTRWMQLFREKIGDIHFVLLGAPWDVPLAQEIEQQAIAAGLKFTNLAGKTVHIGAALHVISLSKYFMSFPSGLGILSDALCVPATMFYANVPVHINMVGKWADPESIASLRLYEKVFCPVEEHIQWLTETYQMKNYL